MTITTYVNAFLARVALFAIMDDGSHALGLTGNAVASNHIKEVFAEVDEFLVLSVITFAYRFFNCWPKA